MIDFKDMNDTNVIPNPFPVWTHEGFSFIAEGDILYYYDEPCSFTFLQDGNRFYAHKIYENQDGFLVNYAVVPIAEDQLKQIKANVLPLRDLFVDKAIIIYIDRARDEVKTWETSVASMADQLPDAGITLYPKKDQQ